VNRSNICLPPTCAGVDSTGVLLVRGLLAHAELAGDIRPGPPLLTGVLYLQLLEALDEASQRSHCAKAGCRIATRAAVEQFLVADHVVSLG
jgi:hypothetical protein